MKITMLFILVIAGLTMMSCNNNTKGNPFDKIESVNHAMVVEITKNQPDSTWTYGGKHEHGTCDVFFLESNGTLQVFHSDSTHLN